MERYFGRFPQIKYNGYTALNITKRVRIVDGVLSHPFVFYPYQVRDGQRVDIIAARYYDDPYLSWLLYHGNKVIDPYYDWSLDYPDFISYIESKYGGVDEAQRRILFYRNNWYDDPNQITTAQYDSSLDIDNKKYYVPSYDSLGNIIAYERKQADWVMNTNKIVKFNISTANTFSVEEVCQFYANSNSSTVIGTGEVVQSNTTCVHVKNIVANSVFADGNQITGLTSNVSVVASGTPNTVIQNISNAEQVYWSPVTYYDYEEEVNKLKSIIKVLDSAYTLQAIEERKESLK